MSLVTKIKGTHIDTQQGDLISLFYFFQNKERGLKTILTGTVCEGMK
jgi:hypothetical protein